MPARSTTAPPLALAAEPGAAEGPVPPDRSRRLRGLIDDSFDLVARVVRNLGVPPGEVDDVVQRVFASAAARLADIAPGSERAFLVQVAVRWAANARRARARLREVGYDDVPEAIDPAPSPEDLTEQRRAATILDRLLAAMDLDLRAVFILDEIEEMSRAEIAQALGIPEGTVASRLRRARQDFQGRLTQWKVEAGRPGPRR